MAEHVTLQPADMIEEIVSAVDSASDELRRLSLEVCQSCQLQHEEKVKLTFIIDSDFQQSRDKI